MEIVRHIQEHPILFALVCVGLLLFLVAELYARKLGGDAKSSDRARIIRCSFIPSPMSFPGISITRMSDGMSAPAGTLRMVVGTPPFTKLPQSVDVKLLVIDKNKKIFEASKQLSVKQEDIIGIIDAPFPIQPYEKEFLCKAWVVAAYYEDGSTWVNDNASAYEAKNKKFIISKLNKIQ